MKNVLRKSLKIRLFVVFLCVSVGAVSVLGLITYFESNSLLHKTIVDGYSNINSVTEMAIVQLLDDAKTEFMIVEQNRIVAETVEKTRNNDPGSKALLKELSQSLEKFRSANPHSHIVEYFVLDLTGRIIATSQSIHLGYDESANEYFREAQKQFHMRDVYKSPRTGQIGFVMAGPIRASNSNEVLGIFAARFNMGGIEELISNYDGMGKTGETYVVNNDGYVITASRFDRSAALKRKVDVKPVRLWHSEKKEFSGVYTDYRGQSALGVGTGSKLAEEYGNLNWFVLTTIDAREAFAPARKLGSIMILIGLIVSGITALVAYFVARSIANPVSSVAQIARRVGEGDLTANIAETKAEDEIGILSRSFNLMITNLRSLVSQVSGVADDISASGQQLSSSAQEMNATAEEVSSTVQQVSKGTETQAQKVEETRKVLEEMATAIVLVSRSAEDVAGQAMKAAETARKGGEFSREAQEKMKNISEVVTGSANAVRKLNSRSDEMGEIVAVISGIADQTNLLALNAAIEAARAGEYGRGFAVVAEEVRKLAEGSAKAADEIGKLIKNVQKETTEAVNTIQGASEEADAARDIAENVVHGLSEIIRNAEIVAESAEQVSATSQQQAAGTKQVSGAVADIASVAEETAAATEEASASTEEMTASMEELASSAQELADMGITLRDAVRKFKLGDEIDHRPPVTSYKNKPQSSRMTKQGDSTGPMNPKKDRQPANQTDEEKELVYSFSE